MRIGVDVDGVLTDSSSFFKEYGTQYAKKIGKGKIINPNGYEIKDIFDWGEEASNEFWEKFVFLYAQENPPMENAAQVLTDLKKENNQIIIITARTYATQEDENGKKMRECVTNWLDRNKIPYDKIVFSNVDKRKSCKDNQIDVMIEDSPHNIIQLAPNLPVICFDQPYNHQIKEENVIRCYGWKEIEKVLKERFL